MRRGLYYNTFDGVLELDPDDTESSIKFWNKNGFLDGIADPTIRGKCAVSYTRMAQYVFGPDSPSTVTAVPGLNLELTSIPIVRRVVCGSGRELTDPEAFIEFAKEYFRDKADHYEKISHQIMHPIDIEAQATADFADSAVKILNEPEEECDTTIQSTDSKTTAP